MNTANDEQATTKHYDRGCQDANRGRSPIFRRVGSTIVAEIDDGMADEWDQEAREAYLDGYESAT